MIVPAPGVGARPGFSGFGAPGSNALNPRCPSRLDVLNSRHENPKSSCRVNSSGTLCHRATAPEQELSISNLAHPHASNLLLLLVSTLNSSPGLLPFIVTDVNRAWSRVP
jgi:hypothetical protein